ncbi:MAG TPA: methyltransferase [Actinophytocola sp.]|uniref:methyltransferase n=1 Tax=Actinophytocola sp. TaxID=1872138 RepID=UPI002DDDB94A|nr:methyltransferase [Actinophytocola sp.]HEV2780632.1 methyltransferase [Actinophytocola sp.]
MRTRVQRLGQKLVPAPIALLELAMSSMLTQAIAVAAELRIADTLADGPLTAEEIAGKVGADPDGVYRLLRLLASNGIFAERRDGRFRLTPMGAALRSDTPGSMRDFAAMMGHPLHWEEWSHLLEAVKTGEPSLPKVRGMGAFEFFAANPEYATKFMTGMGNLSKLETDPILAAYDFSRYGTIVDVAGGGGGLLAGILKRAKKSRGVLFEARAAELGAEELFAEAGVADRATIDAGGLFDPVTPGGDAYLLKHILHDWPEPQAMEILRNVRKAIADDGRLFLFEFVTPQGNKPHPAKLVDVWLMLMVGGRERTEKQYAELLAEADFTLERVVHTASAVSIVVARPS